MADVREGVLRGGLPYLRLGQGPPVVIFSGLSAENANPRGAARRSLLRTVEPLGAQVTVYVVNRHPGLRRGTTITNLADDYAEAIVHEFAEAVSVIGISTGGSIAQRLAIDHPALLRRLVLLASAATLSPYGRRVQRNLAQLITAGQSRRAWASLGPALASGPVSSVALSGVLWLLGAAMTPDDPADLLTTIEAEDRFDASAELRGIHAPTLIIAGGRDRFYSPDLFRATAAGIPHALLLFYPHMGHAAVTGHRPAMRQVLHFLRTDRPIPVAPAPSAQTSTTAAPGGRG